MLRGDKSRPRPNVCWREARPLSSVQRLPLNTKALGNIPPRTIVVNDLHATIAAGFGRPPSERVSPGGHRGISSPSRGPLGAPTARRLGSGRSPTAIARRTADCLAGAAATAPARCGVRAAPDRSASIRFNGPAS